MIIYVNSTGESRREGSTDEPTAPDADVDTSDANTKEPDKDNKYVYSVYLQFYKPPSHPASASCDRHKTKI